MLDDAFLDRFYAAVLKDAGVTSFLPEPPPLGLCVRTREGQGERFVFLLNFAPEMRALAGLTKATLVSGTAEKASAGWSVPANGAAVLRLELNPA